MRRDRYFPDEVGVVWEYLFYVWLYWFLFEYFWLEWNFRWKWRDGGRFLPEPKRITSHEYGLKIACPRELLPGQSQYLRGLQWQLGSTDHHDENLLRSCWKEVAQLHRRRLLPGTSAQKNQVVLFLAMELVAGCHSHSILLLLWAEEWWRRSPWSGWWSKRALDLRVWQHRLLPGRSIHHLPCSEFFWQENQSDRLFAACFTNSYFPLIEFTGTALNSILCSTICRFLELSFSINGQANATFGTCDVPQLAPPPPAALASNTTPGGTSQAPDSSLSPLKRKPARLQFLVLIVSLIVPMPWSWFWVGNTSQGDQRPLFASDFLRHWTLLLAFGRSIRVKRVKLLIYNKIVIDELRAVNIMISLLFNNGS